MGITFDDVPVWDQEFSRARMEEGESGECDPLTPRQALEAYVWQYIDFARRSLGEKDEEAELRECAKDLVGEYRWALRRGSPAAWGSPELRRAGTAWATKEDDGLKQLTLAYLTVELMAILLFRRPDEIVTRLHELDLIAE